MRPQAASRSDKLRGLSGELSPDQSSCSSDTGEVLIRSTRVLPSEQRHEAGPGPGSVQITVQKLPDPPVQPPAAERRQSSAAQNQRRPNTAPALRAAVRALPGKSSDRPTLKNPERTKENREPTGRLPPAAERSADRKLSAGTRSHRQPGHDLVTSRFAAGGRGVVLAALKQRSHSAPSRREVRVQLLDPGPLQTSSQDAVGEAGLSSGFPGDDSEAAAAAAHLMKSDVEARVSQMADGVQKLLQAHRDSEDRGWSLSQQTLHHLETLHSQQLRLQSQLVESALRIVMSHAPVPPTNCDPTLTPDITGQPAHLQVTHLDTAANISDRQHSSSATTASAAETGPVAMVTPHRDRWPEQTSDEWHHQGAPGVSKETQAAAGSHLKFSANHSQAAAKRASEMLREMGRLKTEMRMLLAQPEESLKNTRLEPNHCQSQQSQSQPSQSQQSKPQQSKSHQSKSQQSQSQQSQSRQFQSHPPKSLQHQSQQKKSQSQQSQSQPSQSQQSKSQQSQSQQSQSQLSNSQQSKSHQSQSQQLQSQQLQSQQLQSQQSQSQLSQSQQSQSQQSQSRQFQSHPPKSLQHQSQQKKSQSQQDKPHLNPFQQIQSEQNQSHRTQPQQLQSVQVQRRPLLSPALDEAGRVLRQVQRQKKVLEENLDALLRAKTGEVLHCQLEALAANRDWTEEVRIKKTVDAWISTLSKDIQVEMASEDAAAKHSASRDASVPSQQRAAGSSAHTGRVRPVSALRGTGSQTTGTRRSRGQTPGSRQEAEPDRPTGGPTDNEQVEVDGESYLTRLYGRAPYEGQRRTLKKSPYLRFSSPGSPLGRKPRPRLVESVRGVKLKSCKTQTCLAPPLSLSPGRPQHHYIISSSHLTSGDPADLTVTPADSYSVPMAIPLGRPRMDSSSRRLAQRQQEVTSSPPTAPPTSSVVAADNEAPELQSELSSNPQKAGPLDAGEVPPPPPPTTIDIMEEKNEEEEEDEENVFPGTDFLCVTDVVQQEEVSVVGEEAVELDGGPSPPPVLYQGPVFPPQGYSELPVQDSASLLGPSPHGDALEDRLVEWVEQQLMSRMISEMYRPPPSDPAQNDSTNQSEFEEQSVTSDIVEAAGGGGLQLFVDSNVPVDSALIRQLVDEVLTEHIRLMLGHRDTLETEPDPGLEPPKPGPGAHQEETLVPVVPTPEPTPPPSLTPPSRETPPLVTPPPSEQNSLLNEESPQPITAPEQVATPTPSPEPAHSAGNPAAAHKAPPPLTWEDAELPLVEERPEEHHDTHTKPLLMSVAEDEPPLSSPPLPPPSFVPPAAPFPSPPPAPEPRPASPSSPSEDSSTSSTSSSSSSSSVVTAGTDAALKHISEGELLISVNQLAAMTEEEAVCSFSSSLQELQEMDFDPPSDLQVRGKDLLLTNMEQGVSDTHTGERPQPEVDPHLVKQIDTLTAGRRMDVHLPSIRPEEEEESAAHTGSSPDDVF